MRDWADNPIAMFLVLRTCLRVAPVVARSTGIFCAADAAKNRCRWALGWRRVGNAMRRRVSGGRAAGACGGEPTGGLTPDISGGTGRCHPDFNPADAELHQSADLKQLETNGAHVALAKCV